MKLLGVTDERETCDCCGKRGLKRVVALEKKSGEVVYYGSNCAALALYGKKTPALAKRIDLEAQAIERERERLHASKLARVATEKGIANYNYNRTRRPAELSYFASRGPEVVRVDGSDMVDVEFYKSIGFTQSSKTVAEVIAEAL